jgi:hypothetical protein
MCVRAFDGTDWSDWDTFTFTTEEGNSFATAAVQTLPYASSNASVGFNGDTDDFIRFVAPANGAVIANLTGLSADIDLFAYNSGQNLLASSQAGGSTSEMVQFQVVAGQSYFIHVDPFQTAASNYSLSVTFVNTPPVATINDHTLNANQWAQIANWISYSDADGNPAVRYQFRDGGGAAGSGYFWTPNNPHHPAGTAFTVAAADLNSVWVRGGQSGGSETMEVRVFDGIAWSAWDTFTLTTVVNTPPVATINDHTLNANQWAQIGNWISYSDANGNPATQYQFWDGGTAANSGYLWTPGNSHHPASTAITVAASDLANVWIRGGQAPGSEIMYVRAFDGSHWGAWDSFWLTTG